MMNKFVKDMTIVAALLVLPTAVFAQTHYTPVGEGKYESYMNFTGQVVENGVPVNGAEVAMFVAGECRQTQVLTTSPARTCRATPTASTAL